MTSAPMSANILPHIGPDTICANSITLRSSRAFFDAFTLRGELRDDFAREQIARLGGSREGDEVGHPEFLDPRTQLALDLVGRADQQRRRIARGVVAGKSHLRGGSLE